MSTNDEPCIVCRINHHEPGAKPCVVVISRNIIRAAEELVGDNSGEAFEALTDRVQDLWDLKERDRGRISERDRPAKRVCYGWRVKSDNGRYVTVNAASQVRKTPTLSRAEAHRLLALWLDCGYTGHVVRVVKRA